MPISYSIFIWAELTSNEKSDTNSVNQNGSNGSGAYGQKNQNKRNQNNQDDTTEKRPPKSDLSYLGTIIDITR